jgi:hypothetical protein
MSHWAAPLRLLALTIRRARRGMDYHMDKLDGICKGPGLSGAVG